ncbi:peptide/nickel transport system substrate-binding protein [Rhizobium sp. BK313]|uniref:ABC transporter substrate-binding protein n=1 Tax=Rhizobium sp. BK313 TaxID=2587081 RepID=UPI0010E6BAE4|nr:ABC transporter substrate-binding protein [Rhizobium sp. BK313]MBB3459290.1 peptide/nickel transport system substrate-binding protein [Rhizobium sp. BK313]
MSDNSTSNVLIPVGTIGGKFDNDDPDYVFAPDLYLGLALAYDTMAAPNAKRDSDGIWESDYTDMQSRLALRWEEQENGDWIVWLRPGVISNRGHEFNAADLQWVLEKAFAHSTLSSWRWRDVIGVKKVEIIDRHCLRYCLRAPYPTFPNWLLSLAPNVVDSTAICENITPDDPWGIKWLNGHVAGYGAYDLARADPESILFTRRSDYWRGLPDAASIEVRKVADRPTALRLLSEKRPTVVVGADPDEAVSLLRRDDLTVQRTWAGHVSIEINFTHPQLSDKRVRHALAFATPYAGLIADGLLGQARPWRSPVKSFSQWYSDAGNGYGYDLAKARDLLKEAGFGSGLELDFYLERRADCERMADIIARTWSEIGIQLTFKDAADAPRGWLPPLYLRTECAHNLSEPIYDIIHDYAAMDPIFPAPGGPPNVGTWTPRWEKNEEAIIAIIALLEEKDRQRKRQRFDELQKWLIDFSSSIFIAEGQQVMAANRGVPASLIAPDSRFYHAMQYQNATSNYLPKRSPRRPGPGKWW